MLLSKKGFPEESELVLCNVTSVQHHSVFVNLEEYGLNGMIHISEVSPGRIRNIRDFVREGKIVVCKVLRVNSERGHVDLSLRRVTESQKRSKVNEIKQQQKIEKITEIVAQKLKKDPKQVMEVLADKILKEYPSVYSCFVDVAEGNVALEKLKIDKDVAHELESAIKLRIKPAEVSISGYLNLTNYSPEGVNIVKEALRKVSESVAEVSYIRAGRYKIVVKAANYKIAEQIIERASNDALGFNLAQDGIGSFSREG
ncbi:translation initiation factor IF-2 subunit alpha [Candidatus Woesearchaeota archaeon]|nr:translation initiation factor IF-2 subunit alpha [Candidatus Woesearchaeota archaeon]